MQVQAKLEKFNVQSIHEKSNNIRNQLDLLKESILLSMLIKVEFTTKQAGVLDFTILFKIYILLHVLIENIDSFFKSIEFLISLLLYFQLKIY